MVSKRFLLIALAFAAVLLITSEIAAAKELASNHESGVEDAKYDQYDHGYYNGGGRGGYHNGGGGGRGRGYCRHGCCGGGRYYNGGCRCCSTLAEATAYKQAHEAQTHN
ncbi:hypothetical protein L1987_19320 [Smallanthus sonchifolius]|uniref:Uncharacterized protein n=1 Tax=Smallanthus sonchifolius TaxID=185202 RepID=A0ACB9IQT4_9ASTR|nr:hypothetical protein L1987_19320 [Smallanthus sonchifolius]